MKYPLLSIIVPTYNNVTYIRAALISLINQTDELVEVIIINDGSTDGTQQEIENLLQDVNTSSDIIFISQDNVGVAKTRNRGLSLASGDFIAFLDGDDILSPRFYSTIKPIIESQHIDLIDFYYSDFSSTPENDKEEVINITKIIKNTDMDEMRKIFLPGQWHVFTRVFACHLITGYTFPNGRRYEDMAYTPYAYMRAQKIMRLNMTLYFYRSHPQSITRNLRLSDIGDIEFIIQEAIKYTQESASFDEKNILIPLILINCFKEIKQMHKKIYGYYNYNDSIIKTLRQASQLISHKEISIKNKLHMSNPWIWRKISQWKWFLKKKHLRD